MSLKKLMSSFLMISLIASQMALAASAGEPSATVSPETTLLLNVSAMQGEKLTQAQVLDKIQAEASTYLATAKPEGQQDRMQQALISLKIYSPAQAQALVADSQDAITHIQKSSPATAEKFNSLMTQEMIQLATLHPSGAQFSSSACVGIGLGALAGFAIIIGAIVVSTGGRGDSISSADHPVGFDVAIGGFSTIGLAALIGAVGCR